MMTQHMAANAFKTPSLNGVRVQPSATSSPLTAPARAAPNNKYVSLFRIDGVPILPPVMTAEKRRQMQRLREKAIKIEMKLDEGRRKMLNIESESDDQGTITPRESNSGSLSQRSFEIEDLEKKKRQEIEDQCRLLSSFLETQRSDGKVAQKEYTDSSTNTSVVEEEPNQKKESKAAERLQKLQKSETLIYDNRANAIIMPMSAKEMEDVDKQLEWEREQQREWEQEQRNREQREQKLQEKQIREQQQREQQQRDQQQREQQQRADLQDERGVIELRSAEGEIHINYLTPQKPTSLGLKQKKIPAICVDPPTPTPQASSRSFCEAMGVADNATSTETKVGRFSEMSSDDSMDGRARGSKDIVLHRKISNITGKIIQFEQLQSTETSSPEQSALKPPQRSATSPSLKQMAAEQTPVSSLEVSINSSQSENPLVRSNSFTLDYPSKALLEHIRQQKSRSPSTGHKRMSPSPSATRDTVESKAKRVQKVELKNRQQAQTRVLQTKSSSNSNLQQAGHPINNAMSFKNKRSPYESKSLSKTKLTRQLKKSTSSTTTLKPVRSGRNCTSSSMSQLQAIAGKRTPSETHCTAQLSPAPNSGTDFADLEAEHRQKFLRLLDQQKQEQKRLQLAFEQQQQLLFEQLSAEIGKVQLHAVGSAAPQLSPIATGLKLQKETPSSTEASPRTLSEYGERVAPKSPSLNSTGFSDLPSLESTSSTMTVSGNINRYTPRRRLFARESPSNVTAPNIASTAGGNFSGGIPHTVSTTVTGGPVVNGRRLPAASAEKYSVYNEAATKINAGARGFLTRRLFQTEQIQRIVQTIRDTLIFVLNLHMETSQCPEEAKQPENVKLKLRLLQQLSSASRTLHLVFFQTTVKERMDIIARDRKRIKTKLLSMNVKRSPRV